LVAPGIGSSAATAGAAASSKTASDEFQILIELPKQVGGACDMGKTAEVQF
jgi:hypothetical protein